MARLELLTDWRVESSPDTVWDTLADYEGYALTLS